MSYRCFVCNERLPPLNSACENCGAPNPPHRHVRIALSPILRALRWANRRNPLLPRVLGWVAALALIGFFSPLIVSWWMLVGFWWFLSFIGSGYRIALLGGLPIGMVGIVLIQEAAGGECEWIWVCAAESLGLLGGTASTGGVVGNVLLAAGLIVMVMAVRWGYRRSSQDE